MTKRVHALVLSAALIGCTALPAPHSQPAPSRPVTFSLPSDPGEQALQAHDLAWIRTGMDFDQDGMTAEQIDEEISRRIRTYDRETSIATFEVPINSRRLSAPVRQRYATFLAADSVSSNLTNAGQPLDREAYFWKYGSYAIAAPGDTYRDQLNVYAVARALEILRVRYPIAYDRLFLSVREFPADSPTIGVYKNRYRLVLFSFDESPLEIAAGATAFANLTTKTPGSDIQYSANTAIVSIDNTTIQGFTPDTGSQPIYRREAEENYVRYLREGLAETLVHEMLHRYVDYRYTYDPVYNEIRKSRDHGDQTLAFGIEEAIVTSTSFDYFLRQGGLQADLAFFYRGKLEVNVTQSGSELERYAILINPGLPATSLYKERLRLPVLAAPAAAAGAPRSGP